MQGTNGRVYPGYDRAPKKMSSERKQGKHVPAIPGQREQSQACPGRQRRRAEADQESGDGDAIEHEPETEKSPKAKHRCLERIFHFKEQVIAGWHFQTTGQFRWCGGSNVPVGESLPSVT